MKGRYNKDTRRVFTSSGYKITIAVIIAIAIALMMLLLVFLPVVDDTITEGKTIVSIVSNSDEIGVGVDLSQILCTVYYSDGTHSEVAFTELNIEGLDVTKAGLQNVSLNYGGFEQTITLEVKDVSCQLQYQASVGGRIQGETTQLVPNGSDAATVIAIPETGYFFEGWNDGYPEATRTDRQVNKNATYIATFRKATYTVRFWQPDASIAVEERVAFGEAPAKTPNPEADPRMQVYGHTFSNWIPHDFSSIDRDMDIYPEYIKTATDVEVEIPTDIYGASMGTTDLNEYGYYAYGEAASIISNPYNSRVLAYWEIQTSSGEYERLYPEDRKSIPVGSSSYHTEFISTSVGSNRHKLSFEANENINKVRTRAIFAHEQSEIRFVHNQNLPEIGVRMLRYGDTIGSLINDSDFFAVDKGPGEVIGMKFLGWFTEGTNIPVTEDSIFEQPATVIARWEKRTYTVRFYYEGEDYTYDKSVYVQYGNTLASATSDALGTIICGIPSEIPYKNHYIFVGWQNGITQEIIDDKTKITTHPLYLDNGKPIGDFANRIVTMIPIFAPIKHKLTVAITGAGSVNLHIKEGAASSAPEYTMTELSGVVEIREDFIYTISFEASVGYALKRVIKTDINGSVPYIFENNEDNITININPLGDNDIIVEFEHKKFDINISIDESVGSIEYLGNYLISKDNLIKLQVDYNASINLIIGTINPEFTIENIMVDGQYLMFENGEFMGADLQEYTLNLEQIRRDIEIIVNYKSKKHKVVTPNLQSGSIQLTSIYNPNVTTDIANTENEYVHGTENVYRITAPLGGYYISDIKINGYSYDFYNTGKASLIYHNWYINGVNSQITVVDINGELYYHYGNFEYNGKTYAYCQTAKGALVGVETVVFEIKADSVYDKVIDTAIISAGYNLLNIQSRNIYSTTATKDLRITAIDLLLIVDMNYAIEVAFSPISYKVSVESSPSGTVTITNAVVGYNGVSTVTAKPKTGYYIYGYTINGGPVIVARLPELTSACPIRFILDDENDNRIREDKHIVIVYRRIQIAISVKNTTTAYNVYLDGSLLNSSIDKIIDYKQSASYQISLDNGNYRISSIVITTKTKDGDVVNHVTTHYNMTSYKLTFNDVTQPVIVEIACAPKTNDVSPEENTYFLQSEATNIENITYSVKNKIASIAEENEIIVIANAGYEIKKITLSGNKGNTLTQDLDNLEWVKLAIPAGAFAQDEIVDIRVVSQIKQYDITTIVVGGDDFDFEKRQPYGASVAINIREVANHYIAKFMVNGEEISFDANNWVEKRRNENTKEYISGTYLLVITQDTTIYLEYELNYYNVTLDSNSINGVTEFYSGGSPVTSGKLKHGENLIINMSAVEGYHIKSLYINNVLVQDLNLPSSIANNNTRASYTYQGVNSSLTVKVVYEINRYSFTYEIENISKNFASYELEPGSLTTESNILKASDFMFTGIEYGRNFYINAIPATLNGYYLVSISIRYDGRDLTIPAGENRLISSRGGMIYFNTMLDFNEGIRQDVELIKLTFDKLNYDISLQQESLEHTGSLALSYEHPNSASNIITLFGDDGKLYYYYPQDSSVKDSQFNDLDWIYNSQTGKYNYVDINGDVRHLKVEHGIRYIVNATPTLGYRRTHFMLNGNDVNNMLSNNTYKLNIARNTDISVNFAILTYTVNFTARVADKNLTGRIPDSAISNYATISIVDFTNPSAPITYPLLANVSTISMVFNYGTKIKLVMTPKFATTGYYLDNMYFIDREIREFEDDTKGTVTYGGADGISLTSDINAIANFHITTYKITTVIDYIEPITGESANTLINEGHSTIAWGDTATIKVASGSGYELGEIYVTRDGQPIFVTLTPTEEQLATDLEKYVKNDYSIIHGLRDVIVVRKVESDIVVTARFIRKNYTVNFNFTNANFLDYIEVALNQYNPIYPTKNPVAGYWSSSSTYQIDARHYDELAGTIAPKNGYEIMEMVLTLKAVYWDQSTLSYKPLKDYGGNDIIYYLPFTTVSGDILSFTFHEPTKLIADLSLESDLMIDLTVRIKTYTVDTAINRDSSDSKAPNDTAVTMSVRTEAGQNVRVNNVAQVAQTLTTTNKGKIYIAEHHGTIIYDFDAPEGYMLSNIFVNGINWTESMLKASSYSDEYLDITASKIGAAYRYKIVMKVKDPLIEGHNHIVYNDMSDLTVVITIKLITYEIKSIINGVEYESVIIDNRNTFTDNQTIKVVSANTTNHYNNFNISPEIFQGYQVIGMNMSIYTNGVLTDIGYAFNIEQTNTILINHVNLKYVNVLEDNLVLYICYTTEIKRYNVDIFAYAYSIDIWQDTTEGRVNNNSTAGVLTVSALTNGVRTEDITTAYRHEYFTIITGVAYAKTDYILYSIQEYIGPNRPEDWLTSSNWVDVKDGVRGIDYSYVTEPNGTVKYTFEYQVDDYGDRTFRAVFRQQTTVTVNVINPYRFSGTMSGSAAVGNMNYIYYPEIVARIGGAVVPNIYDNGINNVVDTYIYKVNVGSVMTMQFFDNGASANDIFGIYYIQNDKYVENTEIKTGFEIRAKWDFYLIAKTKLYITYQKEVNAASTAATGGAILFALDNGDLVSNESSPIPVYNEATVTQTVTIVVQPYQNYIFTGLRVRQIDQEASRMAGRIIYAQGASEWLTYNASNFDSLDTNGFIISESINPAGHTTYTITMTGNMELSFVFYKTYNISYTARYSDIGDFDDITLKDNKINNNLLESNTEVSYNSSFTLIAPMADTTLYQFMGWYVNGVNIYRFLSTRYPDINRYTNLFEINGSSMTLEYNNVELDDIEIVALYQRIINVSLINELYYYDTQTMHWNSWTTGAIRTQYYNYVPTQGLPLIKTIENVNNRAALTIESILGPTNASYNAINAMIGGTPAGTDATWNTLAQVPLSFDRSESQAYSSATFFKVLYQNVTNQEYIADTWKTSDIELILTGLPNTVRLQAWQYYDWTSGIYKDIGYSYKDPSGLLDSLGNEIIIDCTNTEYLFNLGYIYSGNMPGAISNASGDARPLIIRPFFRKVVSIELNKLTYIDKLGGNSETEFTPQVGPSINGLTIEFPQTNNFYNLGSPFQYIADDNRSAEFDYGAKIEIRSYRTIDDNGYPVYNTAEENYRFVGWFLNWEVNGSTRYRYIIDMDGDVNRAGENYTIYMTYNFGEEPPEDDTLQYRAVYINQYAHNIYSYNIAGGNNYQDALNNGTYAYKDAPAIDRNSLRINTEAVPFATFDVSKTGINRVGMTELYYSFEIISDESQTHKLEFYIDIGCVYTFDMDMSYINRVANYLANNQYSTPYGFDPSYDKQHKIKFSTDEDKESAYASALSSDYIFSGVNSSNPVDNYIAVSKHLQIDIQYASQVKLVFNKLMWRAGITLPYNLSNQLTDGANHSLTVWDYYSNLHNSYGDPVSTPDGTVHVSFRLNSDRFTNFYNDGVFKYVPYGYKDGLGIPLNKLVYYVNTGNNNQTLFSPSVPQYRRHVVIDLSTYVEGGTLLFGDPYYVGDPYSTENTGAGTLSAPYRIFTARQLKNINLFWYYNEFSCINSSGEITHFKLFENINLQGLNAKTSQRPFALTNGTITEAWLPLCYASGESTNGFDGKLDGNGKYIYGLAALGKADGNLVDTSSTSNAPLHERYDYTFGYGIFGLIKGGIIENLKIGNAYIDVTSLVSGGGASTDRCTYVGVLSAVIEDSTLSDIVFDENLEIGRYGAYRIYINAGTTTSGVGILAGSVKNSIITNITLDVYRTSAMARSNISVIGENAGTLIGSLVDNYNAVNNEGNISSRITNLEIKSTVGLAKVLINTTGTIKYSGGVIGYMEAVGAIVSNTKVNATGSVNVVMELGNSSSIYTGGIVARLRQGTLQDTQISSHAESIYQVAESNVTNVLSAEVGAVGGIAGFNSGVISNRTVTHNPNTYSPFAYTYFERGIAGTFALYGPIAGGIVGINDVEPVFYYDETNPNNNVVIISGEIVGFRLDMGSGARRLVIDAPYVMKNSAGIVSGAKGGIVGYNKQGALIDDCAFGHSNLTISGANHNYLYVYDQNANAGSEKNINELHFNHFTRQGNVGMASYLEGNLYVGGIAGATKGAIYNSYVARRDIFVKYYNAIANSPFKWNVYVGGIAGVQNLDIDDLAISSPVEYTPTKDSILLHPNAYTPLHYTMMYNWSENQGVMNDEIMKTSLAQRARVQSCFISNMQFNVGVYIWTDNNNYQAGAADEESEELTINDSNFIGERQNISVGGILGYNTFTAGAASVNNCYSYSNNFNVKVYAFGSTSTTRDQYQINVGYYHHKTWFGLSNNYYANRIGTNLAINVRGVVAGKATDYSSTATFCWTYGNTINKNNLKMTGDIESIGKNQNDMRSGDNPHYRLIGFDQSAVDADAIAYDGGVVYNMYLNMLEKNTNLFWGYYNDSDNPDSLRQRIIKTSIAGFVGWHESPDGRIFRTDPSTGILMVWHANLGEPNSINDLTWYTEALIGRAWFALDGDIYKSGSYVNAINNPQFLSSYLVDGQVKLSV